MKKIILVTIIGIFLLSVVSTASIGTFKQKESVELYQTCNNCTYCNLTSVKDKTNNIRLLNNTEMIEDGTYYYYVLSAGNTSNLGEYEYCYDCGNIVEKATGCNTFEITGTGYELTTGEAILYFVFSLVLFGVLMILCYFILVMPKDNEKMGDRIIKINKFKYLRILLITVTYGLTIVFLNLLNGLAVNFAMLSIFSGTLGFLFEVMLRQAWLFAVVMIIWTVILAIRDSHFRKQIEKLGRFKGNITNF